MLRETGGREEFTGSRGRVNELQVDWMNELEVEVEMN